MQEGVEVSHSSQLLTPARVCDEPVLEQEAELKAQCVVARESDCRRETGDPQHEQDQLSHEADGVSLEGSSNGHGHGKGMQKGKVAPCSCSLRSTLSPRPVVRDRDTPGSRAQRRTRGLRAHQPVGGGEPAAVRYLTL
eukprot:767779-Hanusia_phi.AAC.14